MYTLAFIFIFLLGNIIGSFLNVVIYRFNTGRTIVHGRSMCMTCSHTLAWYELIPVFSFLFQRGRCRSCASSISHQYPLVEFTTGLVFALIAFHFLPLLSFSFASYITLLVGFCFIFSLLIVIAVYDIRHKVIPDALAYTYAAISFLTLFVNYRGVGDLFIHPTVGALIAGPLLAAPFALLWLVSRGRWMGLGDAKLALGIGWMLGAYAGLAALTLSFWIGACVSLLVMLFTHKKMGMKTEIPFAPFLIIGTLIVFLMGLNIFSLSRIFTLS